jgi:formylglycine-generating enzyme required for sulfatase activity
MMPVWTRIGAIGWSTMLLIGMGLSPALGQTPNPATVPSIEDLERQLEQKKADTKRPPTPRRGTEKAPPVSAESARGGDEALTGPMVEIRGGIYRMGDAVRDGDPDEQPVHDVTIKRLRLGRTEVTRGQFRRFLTATGYRTDAERDEGGKPGCVVYDTASGKAEYRAGFSWRDLGFEQTDEHPAACVSWNDAQAFIAWLNKETRHHFRLPTEAEWEYAARSGNPAKYPWGMDVNQGCRYANGADQTPWPDGSNRSWSKKMECNDHYFYTAPVGSYLPNEFGLHDMIGNVWEWTEDCYHETYASAPTDGSAWTSGDCSLRVVRGGSWDNSPARLRVSYRGRDAPADREDDVGFRLAQDP